MTPLDHTPCDCGDKRACASCGACMNCGPQPAPCDRADHCDQCEHDCNLCRTEMAAS
jgi:hypothetical protein